MRIRLLRAWENHGKTYPIGRIINTTMGERLIKEGKAEAYNGPYPPRKKMKFNLRDINIDTHGNSSNR